MSKFDEHDIEKLLKQMPKIEDQQSSDMYYHQIEEKMNLSRKSRPRKKKSYFYPIVGSVAALFLGFLLLMQLIPGGDRTFNESSSNQSVNDTDAELQQEEMIESSDGEEEGEIFVEDEDQDTGEESSEEFAVEEESESTSDESVDTSGFTRVVQQNEADENNYVTYFFPDQQLQLLVPVTFVAKTDDSYEAFNQIDEMIPDDFPFQGDLYQFLSYEQIDETGDPVIQVDVTGFEEAYPGGSTVESYLVQIIQAYFGELQEETVKIENENGGQVSLSHVGAMDRTLETHQLEQWPYKVLKIDEESEPFYVPTNDYEHENLSLEEAILSMREPDEVTDAIESLPEDWSIEVQPHSESMVELTIDQAGELAEEEMIIGLETLLMTAKGFGFDQVTFQIEGIQQVGPYPIGVPVDVPAFVNPME